jgi:hypothetical protein
MTITKKSIFMQTSKKSTRTTKVKEVKNTSNVTKVNLDKFTDALKNVEVKEKVKKDNIYIYPETMTEKEKSNEVGKKFRNKLRNQLRRYANNIFVFAKTKNVESLEKEINLFDKFYKENYRINDYSFSSITNTKNEVKEKDIKLMLEIITAIKNSK